MSHIQRLTLLLIVFHFCVSPGLVASAPQSAGSDAGPPLDEFVLRGKVVDQNAAAVKHAEVRFSSYVAEKRFHEATTKTDEVGRFELKVAAQMESLRNNGLLTATTADRGQMAYARLPYVETEAFLQKEIEIKLAPVRLVSVRVDDGSGKPVSGAMTAMQMNYPGMAFGKTDEQGLAKISIPSSEKILAVVAWKGGLGLDYLSYELGRDQRADRKAVGKTFPASGEVTLRLEDARPLKVTVTDDENKPLAGIRVYPWLLQKEGEPNYLNLGYFRTLSVMTADNGVATIDWFPKWQTGTTTIWAHGDSYESPQTPYMPEGAAGSLDISLTPKTPVRGRVVHRDGSPAKGIAVRVVTQDSRRFTKTNSEGEYEIGVDPSENAIVFIEDTKWASPPQSGFAIEKRKALKLADFVLAPAAKVRGVLLDSATNLPAANYGVSITSFGKPAIQGGKEAEPVPENPMLSRLLRRSVSVKTNAEGRFEIGVAPGEHYLLADHANQDEATKVVVANEADVRVELSAHIKRNVLFTGKVVNKADGKPVEDAVVDSLSSFTGGTWRVKTDAKGEYQVERAGEPYLIRAYSADAKLGGFSEVTEDQKSSTIELLPLGSVRGRVLDLTSGQPLAGAELSYSVSVQNKRNRLGSSGLGNTLVSDANGNFVIENLIQGRPYTIRLRKDSLHVAISTVTLHSGEGIELGDVREPAPYRPPTIAERTVSAFSIAGTPLERFAKATSSAEIAMQHVLVVFGDPADMRVQKLMELRWQDEDVLKLVDDFLFLSTPIDAKRRAAAEELAKKLDVDLSEARGELVVVMVDHSGKKMTTADADALMQDGQVSKEKFIRFLSPHLFKRLDAKELLAEALERAKVEKKRVIIEQTATWCGPCQLLAKFLKDHPVWEKDYILVKMDERWTGAVELMKPYRRKDEWGIPWMAILDEEGKSLATSNPPGSPENIGYPVEKSSRDHFQKMLLSTRLRLTDEEVESLIGALAKEEEKYK